MDEFADADRLFDQLRAASDEQERRRCRAAIVTRFLPLADRIAFRFVGRGEPSDDLQQVARLALVKTVDRFDPAKGPFMALAVPTILGDVRRHFRDNTWTAHVPRRVKETNRRVRATIDPLSQRLGRAPTATELAAELDVAREDVVQSVGAAYAYRPASLDTAPLGADPDQGHATATLGVEEQGFSRVEDAITVASLVCELSGREREIVHLRFCECLTQTQIAARLGLSQVHVSRLLSTILDQMRARLGSEKLSSHPPYRLTGCANEIRPAGGTRGNGRETRCGESAKIGAAQHS
nr:sigma-70 family RNA polymerase sigma factor [Mycobacterium sp. OAS707]